MDKTPELSIVVPVYNEEEIIRDTISTIHNAMQQQGIQYEIVAVDDGSSDNSYEILLDMVKQFPQLQVFQTKKRGKGNALKTGCLRSRGTMVLFMDADLSVDLSYVVPFMSEIRKGRDIVIASRLLVGSQYIHSSRTRKIMTSGFAFARKAILGMKKIKDTQCGFKMFEKNALSVMCKQSIIDGFCFDTELLYIGFKKGYSIEEKPVCWQEAERESHMNLLQDPLTMLLQLLKIKREAMRGTYV